MARLNTILFDLGHTLIDFRESKVSLLEVYAEVRRRLASTGRPKLPPVEVLAELLPKRISDIIDLSYRSERAFEEIKMQAVIIEAFCSEGIELPPDVVDEMVILEHRSLSASMVLADSAIEVLAELKRSGFKLGIVSNATNLAHLMRSDLARLDILRYFDVTVFSSEVGLRKPHPRIYDAALQGASAAPAATIFVGDRIREDIEGPRALGMGAVLTHQFRQESPDGARPMAIVRDIAEIPEIIGQLSAR